MTLLRISADGLAAFAGQGDLGERLADRMMHAVGRRVSFSERRSWTMSLPVLARDLLDAGLGGVEVLVEHHLPLTSQRVDAILAGYHPKTGEPSFVVVELKQWTSARSYEGSPTLVEVDGLRGGPTLHPVLQVRGYCQYLADFCLSLAQLSDPLVGIAYLHNASGENTFELSNLQADNFGRLFTGQRRSELLRYLKERLDPGRPGAAAADLLVNSAVAPSKQLLAVAAEEIREREQFVLVDSQRLAYELVLHEVDRRRREDQKSIIVVTGGPGSGKSVIALSLLGELARQGRTVLHATGSRSFTQTLRKVVGHGSTRTKNLFKYFNQFMDADRNGLDVLVLDEAHRIRETSVDRWTKARYRTGRPQIDELVAAARVPVFLLDEHQTVRPGELGSLAEIQAYADGRQMTVHKISLDEQFRCGGSEEYIAWVQKLLGLVEGGAEPWHGDPAFAVTVADTPSAMESSLRRKIDESYKARMSAGYCWPWSDPDADGNLVPDVQIDDWSRPWNLKGERSVGGAPPAALWATEPEGFHQVGCVYTAQGFEYDWAGVILGPDLVWRDGGFVSRREHNRDPDFRSRTRVPDEEFDRLVRNVYKVLLTRGMMGTILYSSDAQTRDALRDLVQGVRPDG